MTRRHHRSTLFPYTRSSDLIKQETIQLRFRQRIRSFLFQRVLCREDEERRGEFVHLAAGRDLPLLHRFEHGGLRLGRGTDRKSTRLNSSHVEISYAVFILKK